MSEETNIIEDFEESAAQEDLLAQAQNEHPEIEEQHEEKSKGYIDDPNEYARITGKPKETFKSKEKFDEDGHLLNEIKSLREDVKEWKTTAKFAASAYTDLHRKSYEEAYYALQEQLKEAALLNDNQRMANVQQEIMNRNDLERQKIATHQQAQNEARQIHTNRLEQEFLQRNSDWYNNDNPQLVQKSHVLFSKYRLEDKVSPPETIIKLVEDEIRAFHLNQRQQNRQSAPHISRASSGSNKGAAKASRLNAAQLVQKAKMEELTSCKFSDEEIIQHFKNIGE